MASACLVQNDWRRGKIITSLVYKRLFIMTTDNCVITLYFCYSSAVSPHIISIVSNSVQIAREHERTANPLAVQKNKVAKVTHPNSQPQKWVRNQIYVTRYRGAKHEILRPHVGWFFKIQESRRSGMFLFLSLSRSVARVFCFVFPCVA